MPACRFRYAYSRGGWHRMGGVIGTDGQRVAPELESWLDTEWAAGQEDMEAFLLRHGEDALQVTRHAGQTHFFVAPYGPGPAEFLQLEVEELQEVLDRLLINPESLPADREELSEPLAPAILPHQPVGPPRYRYRRLVDMGRIAARGAGNAPTGPVQAWPLNRFMAEWQRGGGADAGHFCDRWIITLREHADPYGNLETSAKPVSLLGRKLRHFHWQPDLRGVPLGDLVHAFDRAAGHGSAWYFHMVAGALVPRELAYGLMDDWQAGFRYLSERDARLLAGWVDNPYAV